MSLIVTDDLTFNVETQNWIRESGIFLDVGVELEVYDLVVSALDTKIMLQD